MRGGDGGADNARMRVVVAAGFLSAWWILALVVAVLNVGVAGAVLAYARKVHRMQSALAQASPKSSSPTPPSSSRLDPEQVRAMMERLRELAVATAHDVGEHSHRVQDVSQQLAAFSAEGEDPLRSTILAAARQMLEANQKLQAELAATKAELQEHTRRIEIHMAEARTDALAGVANRRAFDEELVRRYAAWQRQGMALSLAILDVDHFKKLNDTRGHQAGDEVLRGIGRLLATTARDMDFVARYGGEEFAVLLPGTHLGDAKAAAERYRTAIANATFSFGGQEIRVTASVGLAELLPGDTPETLLRHADMALYAAKSNGRNRTYFFDGANCLPVDAAALKAHAEIANVVHQQLIEAQLDQWSSDRRASARHRFPRVQSIAPYVNGQLPSPNMFYAVQCRDLTSGGLSFWLPNPPEFSTLVVALGGEENVKHLTAEVVHTTKIERDGKSMYLVGCRFLGRVEIPSVPPPARPTPTQA